MLLRKERNRRFLVAMIKCDGTVEESLAEGEGRKTSQNGGRNSDQTSWMGMKFAHGWYFDGWRVHQGSWRVEKSRIKSISRAKGRETFFLKERIEMLRSLLMAGRAAYSWISGIWRGCDRWVSYASFENNIVTDLWIIIIVDAFVINVLFNNFVQWQKRFNEN